MVFQFLLLIIGLVVLLGGAEVLINGATTLARSLGVSPFVVGLTVVAFGTSAPELFVSLIAAMKGSADVSVGNVIGSNIFNMLMIIGLAALFTPFSVGEEVLKREMPIMLIVLGLFFVFGMSGYLGKTVGIFFFSGIIVYVIVNYLIAMRKGAVLDLEDEEEKVQVSTMRNLFLIAAGLGGMVLGSQLIVDNATSIAKTFGVSDLIIGITLVAIGTSLPELATTIVAAKKRQAELVVGNAIGSNIFNVLCVIGATATISPLQVSQNAIHYDLPFMFFSCLCVLPLMWIGRNVNRIDGLIMILAYVGYTASLIFRELAS